MIRSPSFAAHGIGGTLRRSRPALMVFAKALVWFGCLAWLRPLSMPDEGRYVGVALEMLRSGNWLTPTLDGLPFFHKPPLFYWVTATAFRLFGENQWAARSASILAGAATVAIVYETVKAWRGEQTAQRAALVLATQPLFFGASQFANLDLLVAACISVTILLGVRAALRIENGRPYRRELAGAYLGAALGVLAKGLIGLLVPVLVLSLWLAWRRRGRTGWALSWLPGIAMFAVVALPWFLLTEKGYPGFLHYFIVVQHFQRYAGTGFNNVAPVWFYAPVLFGLVLPWSGWLLRWPRRTASTALVAAADGREASAIAPLMWIWLVTVLAIFSVPQSKLVGYILPALVPMAVLVAIAVTHWTDRSPLAQRLWRWSLGGAAALCIALCIGFGLVHPKSSRELAQQLSAQHLAGEGVAFIDSYVYDLPFYLHDAAPVFVVSDWTPAEVRRHDNWRKELADAGLFAPRLTASRLIDERAFKAALCSGRIKWVVADRAQAPRYPYLAVAHLIATQGDRAVWRTDVSDTRFKTGLACELPANPSPSLLDVHNEIP